MMAERNPPGTFRSRLQVPGPILLAGAHNPLSARLAEEAGFDGIWASGFELSASRAVPDAGLLSLAECAEAARLMAEAVRIPVIADADEGFGNAINVMRAVSEYERCGVAGLCLEDNRFPKRCSFYGGVHRELATVEEHAGKIRAAREARKDPAFVIIARTEALVAGFGLDEALIRAQAYAEAGADLVLVHSKASTFDELRTFASQWDHGVPLVAVPTTYSSTSATELERAGFKVVIFANQGIRSSIRAWQQTYAELRRTGTAASVEDRIAPLSEVFRLMGVEDLKAHERSYLPSGGRNVRAIILAAGSDHQLLPLTADRPKCMLDVKGRPILARQAEALQACGIRDIAAVRGYRKEAVDLSGLRYFDNERFESTGEVASLLAAREWLSGWVLVLYGDILFERQVLEKLLHSTADISAVVDRSWPDHRGGGAPGVPDLVRLDRADPPGARLMTLGAPATISKIGRGLDPRSADGEFIGMVMLSPEGAGEVLQLAMALKGHPRSVSFHEASNPETAALTDLLSELILRGREVTAVEIYKGWMEVDSFEDYRRMWAERIP